MQYPFPVQQLVRLRDNLMHNLCVTDKILTQMDGITKWSNPLRG